MKISKAKTLYIIGTSDRPEVSLLLKTSFPHAAERAYYVTLFEGNLEERLALHTGAMDCPSPVASYRKTLLKEYREALDRGENLVQYVLEGYSYTDEFDDEKEPGKPDYEEFQGPPHDFHGAWISIEDVCVQKDVDKSTVTRAIYHRDLRCGMDTVSRKRYICPDADYLEWSPERKKSYLRDRRILLLFEVLEDQQNVDELYRDTAHLEAERFGISNADPDGLRSFFEDAVVDCPQSVSDWQEAEPDLYTKYNLASPKKQQRAQRPNE